jgi:hypothetical protein
MQIRDPGRKNSDPGSGMKKSRIVDADGINDDILYRLQ